MDDLPGQLSHYVPIMISSGCVYLFIIVAIRIFGKREFAQLSVVDLVFVLLLSNAVQNAMVGPDTTLMGGLVAATTLFIVNSALKYLFYKFPSLGNALSGQPRMLVYKGVINDENLRREHISMNELLETVHEHGCHSIAEVDLAILESDGNISVLSGDFSHKSSRPRKRRKKLLQ